MGVFHHDLSFSFPIYPWHEYFKIICEITTTEQTQNLLASDTILEFVIIFELNFNWISNLI